MSTDERTTQAPRAADPEGIHYEIRVRGHLGARWAPRFDGLSLTAEEDGTTVICGPIVDQAALHGVLQNLRDVGITLVSLAEIGPGAATDRPKTTHHIAPGATP